MYIYIYWNHGFISRDFFCKMTALFNKCDHQLIIQSMSLSITSHYFVSFFWQRTGTISEKRLVFWGYPWIDSFLGIFMKSEASPRQNKSHWSKQVMFRRSNLENTSGGVGLPIYTFPSRFSLVLQYWASRNSWTINSQWFC